MSANNPISTKRSILCSGAELKHCIIIGVICAVLICFLANSLLIYDDLYLLEYFKRMPVNWPTLKMLLLNLDLAPQEYRLYGLSRTFQFLLSKLFGTQIIWYELVIAAMHLVAGYLIYSILKRRGLDLRQVCAVVFTFIFSPFLQTSCFHHYSYLILPYQLTLGVIFFADDLWKRQQSDGSSLWRAEWVRLALLFLSSLALAWTGEAHLPSSILLLSAAFVFPPPASVAVSKRTRMTILAICIASILGGVALHRVIWNSLVLVDPAKGARYHFNATTLSVFWVRTHVFGLSLVRGFYEQVTAVVAYCDARLSWFVAIATAILAVVLSRKCRESRFSRLEFRLQLKFTVLLLLLLLSSLTVYLLLSCLSGQVSVVFPRRYGYMPNTIFLILIAYTFFGKGFRSRMGSGVGFLYCGAVFGVWVLLNFGCLVKIRREDRLFWKRLGSVIEAKKDPYVLFVNQRNDPSVPGFELGVETPVVRDGVRFPVIFESNLAGFWWASQYVKLKLGAKFAAYKYEVVGSSSIRLFGNGIYQPDHIDVPEKDVIVVADLSLSAPKVTDGTENAQIFESFGGYLEERESSYSRAFKDGVTGFLPKLGTAVTIGLGLAADRRADASILPDKRFGVSPPHGFLPLTDYGFLEGEDRIFLPSEPPKLPYMYTDRYGAFTYRLDFENDIPRVIYLDFIERWTTVAGVRPIKLKLFNRGAWQDAGIIDPAAIAQLNPFSYRFHSQGRTILIRIEPGPGAKDVPFINGIRIGPDRTEF